MSEKREKLGKILSRFDRIYTIKYLIMVVASIRKVTEKDIRTELAALIFISDKSLRNYIDLTKDRGKKWYDLGYNRAVTIAKYFEDQLGEEITIPDLYMKTFFDSSDENKPDPEISPERLGMHK